LELEREQFEGQRVEIFNVGADVRRLMIKPGGANGVATPDVVTHGDQPTQARGEMGKFNVHAVFVCRLVFRDSQV
jgi:hypothetical protein